MKINKQILSNNNVNYIYNLVRKQIDKNYTINVGGSILKIN